MKISITNMIKIDSKLLKFGFITDKNNLVLKRDLKRDLYVLFIINKDFTSIDIDVFETQTGDIFQPFYLKTLSTYAEEIKYEIENLLSKILNTCFIKSNVKSDLVKYCERTFDSIIENPWKKHPEFITVKALQNKKWYALFMNVAYKKIDSASLFNDNVDILNIKLNSSKITALIDNKSFFKGYHMNHKHWLTVLLNKDTDLKLIEQLISESYYNVIN